MSEDSPTPDLSSVSDFIYKKVGKSMDANKEEMALLRKSARKLMEFKQRHIEIMDDILEAYGIGMMMLADLNSDMILDDLHECGINIVQINSDEDEDED